MKVQPRGVKVSVRAFGVLRSALPPEPISVAGETVTVRDLLRHLCRGNADLTAALFDAQGQLHPWIQVYVSGRNIRESQGLATEMPDGAELLILRGDIVGG